MAVRTLCPCTKLKFSGKNLINLDAFQNVFQEFDFLKQLQSIQSLSSNALESFSLKSIKKKDKNVDTKMYAFRTYFRLDVSLDKLFDPFV